MDDFIKEVAVEVGKELSKEAYSDLAKPAVKASGELLSLIPRYINAKLEPLHYWIMSKEYNIEATKKLLEVKLSNIDPEKIITPEPYIAVPALQAISYCMDCDEIREMFANLLATSMNQDKKSEVHPAFVEVIKQINPDEAKLIKYFHKSMPALIDFEFMFENGGSYSGKNYIAITQKLNIEENEEAYISNLIRLGIIEKIQTEKESCRSEFNVVEEIIMKQCKENIAEDFNYVPTDIEISFAFRPRYYWLQLTSFGENFCRACLDENSQESIK